MLKFHTDFFVESHKETGKLYRVAFLEYTISMSVGTVFSVCVILVWSEFLSRLEMSQVQVT